MIQIQHLDFMRAVYFHRLDVKYKCVENGHNGGKSQWTLGYDCVCEETFKSGINPTTYVTEKFKESYIDTTPSEVFHCRTCSQKESCDIIRKNLDEFCNIWKQTINSLVAVK